MEDIMERETKLQNQHRVHFTDDLNTFGHDSDIGIHPVNDSLINVHLGFLQIRHRYEITFIFDCPNSIKDELVMRNQEPPNLNVHLIDLRSLDDANASKEQSSHNHNATEVFKKYKIVMEFFAHKEKLLKEKISLHSSQDPLQCVVISFHARVLGKGKGTPFLKNGIKCIGIEMEEEESECSDWQGFE